MADEIIGSARIRIEPDFGDFDDAVVTQASAAAEAAAAAIVETFQASASTASEALATIGGDGLSSIEAEASSAAASIESTLTQAAEEASAALASVGEDAGAGIPESFAAAAADISASMEAAAAESDAALSTIGQGAGDAVADSFSGVSDSIAAELESASAQGSAALSALGPVSEEAAQVAEDAWNKASKGIVGALATIGVGLGVSALVGAGERVRSVAAASEQLIETTGGVANVTSAEIIELADSVEALTGVDGELVQEAENILLTFKNVRNEVGQGNDVFDRAVFAASDLSAVLGGDLTGSVLQLGKALQDPTRGVNALRRAGVDFTAEQREMIRGFVESNDLLSAQLIILDEVESQVGGVAEASRRSSDIIKTQFGNIAEEFSAGLLPAVDELAAAGPRLLAEFGPPARELGEAFGEVLTLGVEALLELTPLLGTTTDLLLALTPVLELAVDLLGAIPGPVLQGAVAVFTMNKALAALRASRAADVFAAIGASISNMVVPAGSVAGAFNNAEVQSRSLGSSLRGLTTGTSGATLAFTAGFTAMTLWNNAMDEAEASAAAFGDRVRSKFDLASMSAEELADLANRLGVEAEGLQEEFDDGIVGRFVNADFNRETQAGAAELARFREEVIATREEVLRMEAEAEFGALADSFLDPVDNMRALREESLEAASAVQLLQLRGGEGEQVFLDFAGTLADAELSEEGMATAAQLLGTDVQSLQTYVEEVTGALTVFVETAVTQMPSVSQAFRDLNEDNRVSAGEFLTGLQEDTAALTTFFSNLETLVAAGFTDVAAELATQGVATAGVVAEQLASAAENGNTAALEATRQGLRDREAAIQESTDFLTNTLGPAFVLASGAVAAAATEAFGEGFDPAEQVRIATALAETSLTDEGIRVAAVAATEGEDAARAFGRGLNLEATVIEQAIAAGTAIKENKEFVNAATAAGTGVGSAFSVGLANGMKLELQEVRNAAGEVVFSAADAARLAARIQSPSKLFAEQVGVPISQGIAEGISSASSDISDAMSATILAAAGQASPFDIGATPGSVAVGRALPTIDTAPAGGAGGGGRTLTVERLVLPTSDPELAASAIISALIDQDQEIGVLT